MNKLTINGQALFLAWVTSAPVVILPLINDRVPGNLAGPRPHVAGVGAGVAAGVAAGVGALVVVGAGATPTCCRSCTSSNCLVDGPVGVGYPKKNGHPS
jgi:hypothetical protein